MATTMQQRINNSTKGSKENRVAVRKIRDEMLAAISRGETPAPMDENEFYVLRSDGQTVLVPRKVLL